MVIFIVYLFICFFPFPEGYYLCTAFSKGGLSEATAEIIVSDGNKNSNRDSKNKESMRTYKTTLGSTLVLKCPLNQDYAKYEWLVDQQRLPENAIAYQNQLT